MKISQPGNVGTPSLTLGTANAGGTSEKAVSIDATIAVYDTTVPGETNAHDAAHAGAAGTAARRDHQHLVTYSAEWFALISLLA